jgi:type IV fimbrial biogenesis protein FimT
MKLNRGVTLIELMVTVAIAAIVATVAVPSLRDFLRKNQLSGTTMEFIGALNYARSEAVRRGLSVAVCKNLEPTNSKFGKRCNATTCASSTGSDCWDRGWIILVNSDSSYLAGTKDIDEADRLRVQSPLKSGYAMRASINNVAYSRSGMTTNTATFAVCEGASTPRAKNQAQAVVVTATSPRIASDTDKDGIPEKQDGTEISSCESP